MSSRLENYQSLQISWYYIKNPIDCRNTSRNNKHIQYYAKPSSGIRGILYTNNEKEDRILKK